VRGGSPYRAFRGTLGIAPIAGREILY